MSRLRVSSTSENVQLKLFYQILFSTFLVLIFIHFSENGPNMPLGLVGTVLWDYTAIQWQKEQLLKMKILVNEQNVSVMYIDINAISLYLDLNTFQQDECFRSKVGMEVEYAKSSLKTSLSQILVICELLPFVRVGQYSPTLWYLC